jgi:hypothetical protein
LDKTLFFAGITAEAAVLVLLLIRRVYSSLPIFSCYIAWSIINDIGVFAMMRRLPGDADRIYLVTALVDATFMFCILIEILLSVLKPIRSSLPRRLPIAVTALAACLCLVAWLFASSSGSSAEPLGRFLDRMQLTTSIARVLFFIVLAALSQVLSLGWRDRELQIATGFGVYSFASLLVALIRDNPALSSATAPFVPNFHVLEGIAGLSYVLSLLYWAFSFSQAETKRREFTPQMQNLLLAVVGNARATRISLTEDSKRTRRDSR